MAAQEIPLAGFRTTLLGRSSIAEGTMAFHFAKPLGFSFKAGQAADLTLLNPPDTDSEGNIRTLSIASPPFEDQLTFATRMRDTAFKRSLRVVPIGTEINIGAPSGSFTLHKNANKQAVFLAGGIGITPFLSVVRQADHDRLVTKLYLFYSNRRPEDAPFLDSLQGLEKTNPNFRLFATMTEMAHSGREWKGEMGFINGEMLARHLATLQGPIYYVAGPPPMVAAMREMLVGAGVDEDDIRTEEFAGY
jgi:ferredoxin-NADP reductase